MASTTKKDPTLIRKPSLFGVVFWVQWYLQGTGGRQYDLFKYMGLDKSGKLHCFRHRDSETIIWKHGDELFKNGFRPFLLNLERIESYYQGNEDA